MTEAEWLACDKPAKMFLTLKRDFSARKVLLFTVACQECVWHELEDYMRQHVERLEQHAEGIRQFTGRTNGVSCVIPNDTMGAHYVMDCTLERGKQAEILREVLGNPFRSVSVTSGWLTSTVMMLAETIYTDRAFDRLPILADALQDAGCDSDDLLSHLRSEGPHVRGCWALDLVLGKV